MCQKSEIIGIFGHTTEAGLDAYNSGDEKEQRSLSNFIDNVPASTISNFNLRKWMITLFSDSD